MITVQFTIEEAERIYDDLLNDLEAVVIWDWDVREDLMHYPQEAFEEDPNYPIAFSQSAASKLKEAIRDASQPTNSADAEQCDHEWTPTCARLGEHQCIKCGAMRR